MLQRVFLCAHPSGTLKMEIHASANAPTGYNATTKEQKRLILTLLK